MGSQPNHFFSMTNYIEVMRLVISSNSSLEVQLFAPLPESIRENNPIRHLLYIQSDQNLIVLNNANNIENVCSVNSNYMFTLFIN